MQSYSVGSTVTHSRLTSVSSEIGGLRSQRRWEEDWGIESNWPTQKADFNGMVNG